MNSKLIAALLAGGVFVAACGSDVTVEPAEVAAPESELAAAAPAEAPAVTDADGGAGDADRTRAEVAVPVAVATSELGDILVDARGTTLYGFTNDADGTPSCFGDCAATWPPVTVESAELPAGLDPSVFTVVERAGEGFQLAAGPWPLYYFSGDIAPGDTNGQGIGDVWFVVTPTGDLVNTAEPAEASSYTY